MHKLFSFRIPTGLTYFLWYLCLTLVVSPHVIAQLTDVPIPKEPNPLAVAQGERLNHIKALLEAKQTDQALVMLEDIFESGPPYYRVDEFMFLHAQALREKNETQQAIIILEQLLEEYPFSPLKDQARLLLGSLYIESDKANRAITVLTNTLNRSSNPTTQSEGLRSLRQAYEMKGEYTEAVDIALKQLKKFPETERRELLDYIQDLILQKMDDHTLEDLLATFPATFPGDLVLIRLIELHTVQGNEVLAEQDIRAFLNRFPNHPYAQTAMALMQSFISRIKSHQYVIAAALPFSGKMKPFGADALNGISLALQEGQKQLGANTLGIVVKNSALPPAQLHHELEQVLKEFEPISLIGPLLARQVQNVADLPDWSNTPFITPTASLSDVKKFGQFWFSTALTTRLQVTKLVDHAMHTLGFYRFSILSPKSTYGQQLARMFQEIVLQNGGEIIAIESYHPATTDASIQIQRLKDKDLSLYGEMLPLETEEPQKKGEEQLVYRPGFDALFLPGHPTDVAFLSAQLAYYDIKIPLLGSNSWNHPDLLKWGRSTLNGGMFGDAIFLESTNLRTQKFIRKYREHFQVDPSIFAAQAYDAMRIILDTISHGATNGQEVRNQLLTRHDFPTFGGLASFGEGGVLNRKVYMIQIANGRFIQIN